MTKNLKTLLKTTTAVATLMIGSQTWGAGAMALYGDDGTDYTGTDRVVTTTHAYMIAGVSAWGTAAPALAPSKSITLTKDGTDIYIVSPNSLAVTDKIAPSAGTYTSTKGSVWHLVSQKLIDLSAATFAGPAAGKSVFSIESHGDVTLPAALDPKKWSVINKVGGNTLTIGTGAMLYDLVLEKGVTTLGANTSLIGSISGAGDLTLNVASTNILSDVSKLAGTVTTAAATTFAVAPQKLSNGAFAATISSAGTIKKLTVSADASTLNAVGNLVIEELALNGTLTLACDTGVTITIKKITGTLTKGITLAGKSNPAAGGGTFVITIGDYTGSFVENAGTLVRK